MDFEVLNEIAEIETIASGGGIRNLARLRRRYGSGRWRKLKGVATVMLKDGTIHQAEIHWYEAHGSAVRNLRLNFRCLIDDEYKQFNNTTFCGLSQ